MVLLFKFLFVLCQIAFEYVRSIYIIIVGKQKKSISGEIVLITGAGTGIGKALALEFAKHNTKLVLWDIDKNNNEATADEIKQHGGQAWAYYCDVSSYDDVKSTATRVRLDVGEVSILVNNAGVLPCLSLLNLSEKQIRKTIDVNLTSHFWTVKEFLPHMMKVKRGHIIEIASMAAWQPTANLTDYSASKFGVRGFCYSLRQELNQQGLTDAITITCVCPMHVDTQMLADVKVTSKVDITAGSPLTSPEKVAEVVVEKSLQDEFMVLIPSNMNSILLLHAILPARAMYLLAKFFDLRMYHKSQGDLKKLN